MTISTFKPEKYRGCNIYYRNFEQIFEFLTVVDGEIYTTHIGVRPFWITRLFYLLGIEKKQYSDLHLKNILAQMRRLAETTIDFKLKNNE